MYYDYQTEPRRPEHGQPYPPEHQNLQLARAYVLPQTYTKAFPPEEALKQGTLFPELVMPYDKRH
ncbi:MAG TPA: spore coat associated protein CotJA [Clostridiales bacterium]|nr:spore coat associated protein CotJA [Clostridiales bacterium]